MFANVFIHTEDDLLDVSFDLTDKEGFLPAKMKISLSSTSGSVTLRAEFRSRTTLAGDVDYYFFSSPSQYDIF